MVRNKPGGIRHLLVNSEPVVPNSATFYSRTFYFKVSWYSQNLLKF